ncbi:hypothetical protein GCM10011395_06140 [Sphingomonas psychrolutea]|uniref:Uncharacterized protein n=1 Tax=Sphingomonas psychrolutea TaxID=1259676 RepID=A0ABQ1G860_9SPHN|nr:hypothetical protein GCM10011395_06140 [Sphingomonas psychrolutea]
MRLQSLDAGEVTMWENGAAGDQRGGAVIGGLHRSCALTVPAVGGKVASAAAESPGRAISAERRGKY